MSPTSQQTVLILDNEASEARRLIREFQQAGFRAACAADNQKITELLVPFVPKILVLDPDTIVERHKPQEWILNCLRDRFAKANIVVQTRRYSLADCFVCAQVGAAAYLTKPTSVAEVLAALRRYHPASPIGAAFDAPLSLARMEWEHINRVLVACKGNKTQAAALLRIPRFTLQRKLSKNPPC